MEGTSLSIQTNNEVKHFLYKRNHRPKPKMKKILILTTLIGLFTACSPEPKHIAKSYAENIAKGDIWEAKKLVTESTGELLDLIVKTEAIEIKPDFEFKFIRDSVIENKAWVTFADQNNTEGTIELIKIKGEWKVHIQ